MKNRLVVDQARLKEFLVYDEMTGVFTWKKGSAVRRPKIGAVAGSLDSNGYWSIRLDGRLLRAHRLAWLYVHGVMPPDEIDHINGIGTDNRIANLRLATRAENTRNNRPRKSASGLKGAYLNKRCLAGGWKPWLAKIQKDRKQVYLGTFTTAEEAHAAYVKAAHELFGQFARTA